MPEAPPSGVGTVATTRPVIGSTFWMRSPEIWYRCRPSKAVPACAGTSSAHRFPAHRIDRFQRVAGRDPDIGAVIADPMHMRDIRKGAVFADDSRCCSFHSVILATGRGAGE